MGLEFRVCTGASLEHVAGVSFGSVSAKLRFCSFFSKYWDLFPLNSFTHHFAGKKPTSESQIADRLLLHIA